jgi:glycolate oxidase
VDSQRFISELESICGAANVRSRPADLLVYEYDGSVDGAVETEQPLAVVLPTTTEEVAEVTRLAYRYGVPVVARGAGTGLSGGAVARGGGVIIALTRMERVLRIDPVSRTALVEPGVINLELSQAVAGERLFFAPDPSSQKACTIGGNVAENSGGPHCLKYGVTTNHILGLEVVLPGGQVVWIDSNGPGVAGLDLTAIMVGSEGMLGIVTKVLVRLVPTPEAVHVHLAAFGTMEDAAAAVSSIIGTGILPASLEMMDQLTIEAVEPAYHAGYPMDAAAVLLVEVDGTRQDVADTSERISQVVRDSGVTSFRSAEDPVEQELLWKGRKMALAAMGRLAPNYYLHDTVVPRTRLTETLHSVNEISREFGLRIANVFHAGDGNLHPLMLFDRRKPGDVEKILEASHALIHTTIEMGGALTGEHGIGSEKRGYMELVYTREDLAAMAGVKDAFDPRGLLNPEKVLPKGYLCGEVRALHNRAMAQKHGIHPM